MTDAAATAQQQINDPDEAKFDHWAIVDLMGHQRYAGRISETTIAGSSFLQLDIPEVIEQKEERKIHAHSIIIAANAIHSIRIVTADIARQLAATYKRQPVHEFDIPHLRELLLPQATNDSNAYNTTDVDIDDNDEPFPF